MPKYDLQKYKIPAPKEFETPIEETLVIAPKYDLAKYKIPTPAEFEVSPESESDFAVLGKSALKGASFIADLPKLAASGLEAMAVSKPKYNSGGLYAPDFQGDDIDIPDIDFISSNIPSTDDARTYFKEKTGIDLEPHPTNARQRMLAHGAEFVGNMVGTGGAGAFIKGAKTAKAIYKPLVKDALTGMTIGTGSGALQEGGVNPLVADISMSVLHPTTMMTVKAPYTFGKRFTKKGRVEAIERDVSKMLKERVGKDNISAVTARLAESSPFNTELMSAELAENAGLAGLHRAYSPNIPAIAEKNKLNNDNIKLALEELGDTTLRPYAAGDYIRKPIADNLDAVKRVRANKTKPLYDELNNIQEVVDLPSTRVFLDKNYANATRGRKGTIDNIRKDIINEEGHKLFEEFMKNYGHLSSDARVQAYNQLKLDLLPRPAKANNVIQELGDKIKASYKKPKLRRFLTETRENLISDLEAAGIPQEKIAREAYAKYSKPVNAIEENPLLSKLVKKDLTSGDYTLPSEKIFGQILGGSVNDTKELVKQFKKNSKALDVLRGQTTRELLSSSGLASAEGNLSYPKFKKLLKAYEEKLNLIYTPKQFKALKDTNEILRKRNFVDTFGRAKGSNTQSETTLINNLFNTGGNKLMREAAAYTLPGGGVIYDTVKGSLDNAKRTARDDLIARALLEPTTARKLLLQEELTPTYSNYLKNYVRPLGISTLLEANRNQK